MLRIRGYKYRAYPNKKQKEFFERPSAAAASCITITLNKSKDCGENGVIRRVISRCPKIFLPF